jgi:hypothetical protein
VPGVRSLVAEPIDYEALIGTPFAFQKIALSQYFTPYNNKYYFIRPKSNVISSIRSVHRLSFEFLSETNIRVHIILTASDSSQSVLITPSHCNVRCVIYLAMVEAAVPGEIT